MAKMNARLKDFFEGKRRRYNLQDYRPLNTKAGERRLKLMVSMLLNDQAAVGMPAELQEEFFIMQRQKSKVNLSKIAVEVEGVLFSIFSTDTVSNAAVVQGGGTLNDFKLVGAGIDDKRTVSLEFVVYLPWSDGLRDWAGVHLHEEFFAEAVPSQMELVDTEPAQKPLKEKKPKKDKKGFDPEAIQNAAKKGELVN